MKKTIIATVLLLSASGAINAQDAPTCDDLVWSAQVLEANPDIGLSCQGVFEQGGELYAKVTIEIPRARGNRSTFRPQHTDGSRGDLRSITVPSAWRANIGGQSYRASELLPGQELNVYMPQDRFALAMDTSDMVAAQSSDAEVEMEMMEIEEAVVAATAMPKTASPLYTILAGALALLGLGAAMSYRRKASTIRR